MTIERDAPSSKEGGHSKSDPWQKIGRAFEIGLLALLVVVGAFQVYIYSRQTGIMSAQTTILSNQTDITKATQRAFIVVDGLQITHKEGDIASWELKPIIKNSGNTPTKNMVFTGLFVRLLGPRPPQNSQYEGVEFPNVPNDPAAVFYLLGSSREQRPLAVLGPQAVLPVAPIKPDISQNLFSRMKELGYSRIVGSGAVLYDDIFSNSKRHITKYCYLIDPETTTIDICGYWNCADEECKADADAYNKAVENAFRKAGKPINPNTLVPTEFP